MGLLEKEGGSSSLQGMVSHQEESMREKWEWWCGRGELLSSRREGPPKDSPAEGLRSHAPVPASLWNLGELLSNGEPDLCSVEYFLFLRTYQRLNWKRKKILKIMKTAADLIYRNYCAPWIANKTHQTLPPPPQKKKLKVTFILLQKIKSKIKLSTYDYKI